MFKALFVILASLLLAPSLLLACPSIQGIPDFNCDQRLIISVFGDSIAYGFGDERNSNTGGYVLRAERAFNQVEFHNFADPGQTAVELYQLLKKALSEGSQSEIKARLQESDIVIIDVGRNDRWTFVAPATTYTELKRISSLIKRRVAALGDFTPVVVQAVLMLPNRGSQGPWVKELNTLIMAGNTRKNPADLRFDLVSKRLLNEDQIHPTSQGYQAIFAVFKQYLTKALPKKVSALIPDGDKDGIPDAFEQRYGTSATLADSDADGLSDGDGVFVLGSDPVSAES